MQEGKITPEMLTNKGFKPGAGNLVYFDKLEKGMKAKQEETE
jgi:hypothetical protein